MKEKEFQVSEQNFVATLPTQEHSDVRIFLNGAEDSMLGYDTQPSEWLVAVVQHALPVDAERDGCQYKHCSDVHEQTAV